MNVRTPGKSTLWFAVVLCAVMCVFCGGSALGQVAATPAPAGEKSVQGTGVPAASVIDVKYENNLLSVKAEKADLGALLKKISETTGIVVDVGAEVSGSVSLTFSGLKLEDGVNRILEVADSKNYAATFEKAGEKEKEFRLQRVSVVRRGKSDAKTAEATLDVPRTKEAVKDYLQRKYGTQWSVDWDPVFNRPQSIVGLMPVPSSIQDVATGKTFIERNLKDLSDVLQIDLGATREDRAGDDGTLLGYTWAQVYRGIEVDGSVIGGTILKRHDGGFQNIGISVHTYPDIAIPKEPKIAAADAEMVALERLQLEFTRKHPEVEAGWLSTSRTAPTTLLIKPEGEPRDKPKAYHYHLVWKVVFDWARFFVDAQSGQIVQWNENAVPGTVSGTFSGGRYGRHTDVDTYRDDLVQVIDGLGGAYVWRVRDVEGSIGDDHLVLPPLTATNDDPLISGSAIGEYAVDSTDLPVYARLQSNGFSLFTGYVYPFGSQNFLSWRNDLVGGSLDWEFPDTVESGHQPNIYLQLMRGLKLLARDGFVGNEPPMLDVHAAVPSSILGVDILGDALPTRIRLRADAGLSSDIVFHELVHTGVFKIRGDSIGAGIIRDSGVNEGIANFFACRMNDESVYDYPSGEDEDLSVIRFPEDWGDPPATPPDGKIDADDWKHYKNGIVLASIMWDLSRGGVGDNTIWGALKTEIMPSTQYRPEDLYVALKERLAREGITTKYSLLWEAFSSHRVNAYGAPLRETGGGIVGARVEWLDYFGILDVSYEIERQEVGTNDPSVSLSSGNSDLEDRTATLGTTYRYRARPVGAGVSWSNWAIVTIGDAPAAHVEIKNLDVVFEPTGQSTKSDGKIYLSWDMVGTLADLGGYKITRTAVGEPTVTTLKGYGINDRNLTSTGLDHKVEYTFRVVAINAAIGPAQQELGLADIGHIQAINNMAPPAPTTFNKTPYPSRNAMFLSWGYDSLPADLSGFKVHYRKGWPGPYDGSDLTSCCYGNDTEKHNCLDASNNFIVMNFTAASSPIDIGNRNACYFIAPAVDPYYIAVEAYDNSRNWSISPPQSFFDSTKPTAPSHLEVSPESGHVKLCWTAPADPDIAGYRIYRKPAEGEAVCDSSLQKPFGGVTYCLVADNVAGPCFEDQGSNATQGYWYVVEAVDYAGNTSEPATYYAPLDVALVIDRSGSMAGSRIEHATRAAALFLDILGTRNKYRGDDLENKHQAGIVTFGNNAKKMTDYPGIFDPFTAPLIVVDANDIPRFQGVLWAIQSEPATPEWTNMTSGLETGWYLFDADRDGSLDHESRNHNILLLSDGAHNYFRCSTGSGHQGDLAERSVDAPLRYVKGELPWGELCPADHGADCPQQGATCPAQVTPFPMAKIAISTVSLGSDVTGDAAKVLQDLATWTGGDGNWHDVSGDREDAYGKLASVYMHMLTRMTGGSFNQSIDDDLGPNETQRQLVSVDSSMREATFIVTWANDEVPVELVLKAPDGSYIDPIAAATGQGIEFVAGRGYQFYHVIEPRAGPWEMVVTAAATTPYSAMLIGESLLKMSLDFDRLAYVANDPVTLSVKIFQPDGTLVPGAQVTGFVQTPSQINEITLNDLGQLGDPVASDGVYTAVYSGATAQGAYTFSLRAAGLTTAGEAFSREDLHSIYVASTSGPEAPRMLTATGGAGYVDLSWINPMSMNLEAVRIMRSTAGYPNNINEGQMVYDGLSVPFRDLDVVNGTTYYYAAFARNTNQEYSLPSTDARALATPNAIDTEPPQSIRNFVAIPGNNSVALYWSNPLNTDFSHVRILRTAGACAGSCSDPSATVFEPPPEATSFTDTTALNGVTYCYAIFAVDTAGNCSGAGTNSSGTATPQAPVIQPPVNDPLFSMQWHLHNEGQTGGKVDADIDAPEAWQIEQGSNQVVIAIVDTGVDYDHPDLSFNIWKNYRETPGNGLDDDGNGYVDDYLGYDFTAGDSDPRDDFGHGTHCAGIADAVTNNGVGVAGVARQAKIQSVKVLSAGGFGYWEWVAAGIVYAADNGADVISMSLGGPHSKLVEDACNYARDKGVVVVAAAGNSSTSAKSYPGGYDSVIAVSATDHNDKPAYFSNFGDWVDVSAPGVNIYATMPTYPVTMNYYGYTPNYSNMSGTSMACPNVAGLAALILARYPDLTNEQVREALRNTGDDLGTPGFDPYFGYGRVNASNAMSMDTVGPMALVKWRVDDDAQAPSNGNGDGVINPGEKAELTIAVKNRGGQNAGAVRAVLSTTDPHVVSFPVSEVAFTSIPRWGVSESIAPVVFEVAADTPVPHFIPFHAVLTDEQGGRWELDFEVSVGIYGPSLRIAETIIDDDNSQESKGNGDGIVNVGEVIELRVRLRNDGDQPASGVQALLSTRDPYIILTDNSEDYGTIPAGGSAFCQFDYDFRVSDNCPDGHEVTLDLQITDNEGRVWADTITFPVFLPPPEVRYQSNTIVADYRGPPPGSGQLGEGDRSVSPGETVELDILLSSRSPATATGVTAVLTSADPLIAVHSGAVEYGDLLGSAKGVRGKTRHSFTVDPNHAVGGNLSFTLTVSDGGGLSWTDTFAIRIFGLSTVAGQDLFVTRTNSSPAVSCLLYVNIQVFHFDETPPAVAL